MESWKASLLRAGVYPVANQDKDDNTVSLQPQFYCRGTFYSTKKCCMDECINHISTTNPYYRLSPLTPEQDDDLGSVDPQLERQVETIRALVDSYTSIVSKTTRDLVPKSIMFMMVNKLKDYIHTDLLPMIYSAGHQNEMMEESQEAAMRREEMIRMYHTCKEALDIISEVNSKTGMSQL